LTNRFNKLPDWLYFFGLLPVASILPASLRRGVVRRLGRFLYSAHEFHREETARNLGTALVGCSTEPELYDSLVVRTFESVVAEDLDAFLFPFWTSKNIEKKYEFRGFDELDRALGKGKGVLLYSAHLGGLCASVTAFGRRGYPVNHLSRDSGTEKSFPAAFRSYASFKIRKMGEGSGRELVLLDQENYSESSASVSLQVLRLLQKNEIVSLALDVPPHLVNRTEFCEFLGRQCRFPTGLIQFAHQSGASVIPFFPLWDETCQGGQKLVVQEEVKMTGDVREDLQSCVDRLSKVILSYPEQWLLWDSLQAFEGSESRDQEV
jgi:KDO2-lipid IV(A) lauroyltransferase